MNRDTLLELLRCHATPGDEAEVAAVLARIWRRAGLVVTRLGDYALAASAPRTRRAPVLLIAAHMDSPGFAVDRLPSAPRAAAGLTCLGRPAWSGRCAAGVLKTRAGRLPVTIRTRRQRGGADFACTPVAPAAWPADLAHGDRVCFAAAPEFAGDRVAAPFLDNRLGCWLLAELAGRIGGWRTPWRVVLGAAGTEETGGFGAAVLARHVQPGLAIVLDATYEAPAQGVRRGGGPVLTLSDASVLLPPARRDRVRGLLAAAGVPLQTEVYNFSGTDARAFPLQGLACPVLPLLLATTGNHTPRETADLRDAAALLDALEVLAREEWP